MESVFLCQENGYVFVCVAREVRLANTVLVLNTAWCSGSATIELPRFAARTRNFRFRASFPRIFCPQVFNCANQTPATLLTALPRKRSEIGLEIRSFSSPSPRTGIPSDRSNGGEATENKIIRSVTTFVRTVRMDSNVIPHTTIPINYFESSSLPPPFLVSYVKSLCP